MLFIPALHLVQVRSFRGVKAVPVLVVMQLATGCDLICDNEEHDDSLISMCFAD